METYECEEIPIRFDKDELKTHEPGFCRYSEQMRYMCAENAFNPLGNFLDGRITGGQFHEEEQLAAYREVVFNSDGSCGEKIHEFMKML